MKKILPVIAVLLLGLVVWSTCAKKAPTKIEWAASLEDALKMAVEKNTPIIADFWSEG
jgi:ABC-type Na+ efflux pump permease subunit